MSFEQLVICHCAPVLRGIKISNLVSCSNQAYPQLKKEVEFLDRRFEPFGLKCKILCECQKFALVFIYSEKKLGSFLSLHENEHYLEKSGYKNAHKNAVDLDAMLLELSLRLKSASCNGFPHEIGIFLGYPLEDVIGFEENHGENFKYSGYWKVYGDLENSKRIFKSYDQCGKKCKELAMKGFSIEEVINYADLKSA